MTLDFILNFVRGVVNNNAPLTLVLLSSIVLVYTIIVSALKQEWVRYVFLVIIGFVLYFASNTISNPINKEFFSGLSTELFGAAIALVVLGKWSLPSIWSLIFLSILVILGELVTFQIKNAAMQSYYLGMASNIWGAFLVAILIEELVHKREDNRSKDDETESPQERLDRKHRIITKQVKKLEKQVQEASLHQQVLKAERLQKLLDSMHPTGWDVEITIHGRNRQHLQSQLLRIQQMVQVIHVSEMVKHPENERCSYYIKASTTKPEKATTMNGTHKAWRVESEKEIQEEARHKEINSKNGKKPH